MHQYTLGSRVAEVHILSQTCAHVVPQIPPQKREHATWVTERSWVHAPALFALIFPNPARFGAHPTPKPKDFRTNLRVNCSRQASALNPKP